jgi:hypothetical protein
MNTYRVEMQDGATMSIHATGPEMAISMAVAGAIERVNKWPMTPQALRQATTVYKLELIET